MKILNPFQDSNDTVALYLGGGGLVMMGLTVILSAVTDLDPQIATTGVTGGSAALTGAFGLAKGGSNSRRHEEETKPLPVPAVEVLPPHSPRPEQSTNASSAEHETRVKPDPPDKPPAIGFDPYKYVVSPAFSSHHRSKT